MQLSELRKTPHLSASSINEYVECSLLYRFGRVDRLPMEFVAAELEFGTAIHKVLEEFYRAKMIGERLLLKDLHELFKTIWKKATTERADIQFQDGQNAEMLSMMGADLIMIWFNKLQEDNFQVVGVEEAFSFNIPGVAPTSVFKAPIQPNAGWRQKVFLDIAILFAVERCHCKNICSSKVNRRVIMQSYKSDTLLHGNIVLTAEVIYDAWISVKDGLVTGIFSKNPGFHANEIIDCSGHFILPGIIDDHVHSFSYPEEGFEKSTGSAAVGGVTTIIEMPYDSPSPVTSPAVFDKKVDLIEKSAMVDVALLATLKKNAKVNDVYPLAERGACGFKLSLFETDVNRFPRIEDNILWEILPAIAKTNLVVGFHAENDIIIEHLISKYKQAGKINPNAHVETRPPITETSSVLKLLELAFWTKASIHIYHVSHPRSIELIKAYKNQGVNVSSETCPHYLILNDSDMDRLGAFAKINPCLRSKEESAMMWKHIVSGDVEIIASDHAPWPIDRKENKNIFENASGSPGVQTLLPIMYNEMVAKRGISPVILANLMSLNPAKRFKLSTSKGSISIGKDADFAIIDPNAKWTIRGQDNISAAKWSPYENMEIKGKLIRTILRGKTVYEDNKPFKFIKGGRFLKPN